MPKLARSKRQPRVAFPTICLAPMPELAVFSGCFESLEDAVAQYEGTSSDRGEARKLTHLRKTITKGVVPVIQPFWLHHPLEVGMLPVLVKPFREVFQEVLEHERYWLHPERRPVSFEERVKAAATWIELPEQKGDERLGALQLLLQQVLFSYALYRAWRGCESGASEYLGAEEGSAIWSWKYRQAFIPEADPAERLAGSVEQMLNFTVQRLGHGDWKEYAIKCELEGGKQAAKSITDKFRRWSKRGLQPRDFIAQFSQGELRGLSLPPIGAIVFPVVIDHVCRLLTLAELPVAVIAQQCTTFQRYVNLLDSKLHGQ